MRSGEHAKALYWLSRTLAILDNERPRRRRLEGMDIDYLLAALFISVVVWIAKG
jgi:predicted nucleic acid-binding Zn ribbon protein